MLLPRQRLKLARGAEDKLKTIIVWIVRCILDFRVGSSTAAPAMGPARQLDT